MSSGLEAPSVTTEEIDAHLLRMRVLWAGVEVLVALATVASFFLPPRQTTILGRGGLSLVMAAAALWFGFSSSRDASKRMQQIRAAFGVHHEVGRLLRGHLLAYLWILCRMLLIAAAALMIAVWGSGPGFSLILFALAFLLVLMTFPTEYKTRLLLKRASME